MKKRYLVLIILGMIVVLAVMTNPTPERHKEALRLKVHALMQQKIGDHTSEMDRGEADAAQVLGSMIGGVFIDRLLDNAVSTDNYVLFSVTKVTWEGKSKPIGVGVFGNVYLSKKLSENLDTILEKDSID